PLIYLLLAAAVASIALGEVADSAFIFLNKGASTIDCTVRALSPTGAGLDVSTVVGLPERFDLAIEADQIIRPCRIVEMKDRHVEVEFA
ncbi:sensor domain-containing diguanylate cyclase, partial [Hansschlegelia beijingensis]